jgi:energy-coupling factor transport system permease protein
MGIYLMLVSFSYRVRNSLLERIDPRARWIFSILVLFAITLFWDLRFLLFFFVLAFAQYYVSRLTWRETRRAWTFVIVIMTMMVLVNTIITSAGTIGGVISGGHPVWGIHAGWLNFTLTIERLWFALVQFVRILAISCLFIVIPFTMDPRRYGVTFQGMGLPDRLAFSLDLAFRFVPTLGRDFQITLDAQRARGYEVEKVRGGLFEQIRKTAPLVVPVTMNAILSGEDITNAMDLRCFGLRRRTWVEVLKFRGYDYAVIAFGAALLVGSIVLNVIGYGKFWIPAALVNLVH